MTTTESFNDYDGLARRLARLERLNRRLRHALVFVGAAGGALALTAQAAPGPRTVAAEDLTLVDSAGQRRATMAAPDGSVVLTLYDLGGRWQA